MHQAASSQVQQEAAQNPKTPSAKSERQRDGFHSHEQSRVLCVNCFNSDMSEQKRLQQKMLKDQERELERKNFEQNQRMLEQNSRLYHEQRKEQQEYMKSQLQQHQELQKIRKTEEMEANKQYLSLNSQNA